MSDWERAAIAGYEDQTMSSARSLTECLRDHADRLLWAAISYDQKLGKIYASPTWRALDVAEHYEDEIRR